MTATMNTDYVLTAAVLDGARELIADPVHWTRNAAARDRGMNVVEPTDPSAFCWCLEGAVEAAQVPGAPHCGDEVRREALARLHAARMRLYPLATYYPYDDDARITVADFNDWLGIPPDAKHLMVLAVLDAAIADCRAQVAGCDA